MTTKRFVAFSIIVLAFLALNSASIVPTGASAFAASSMMNECSVVVTIPSHAFCYLSGSKIGSVVLTISHLTFSGGKYSNIQTTTVRDTTGKLMNGVAITMYENAGKSGGYFHQVTGPTKYPPGETIEHDTYPGPGSYTEWSSATWNGQTVLSLKITVIVS